MKGKKKGLCRKKKSHSFQRQKVGKRKYRTSPTGTKGTFSSDLEKDKKKRMRKRKEEEGGYKIRIEPSRGKITIVRGPETSK